MPLARVLSEKSHLIPGRLKITEWLFEVPLSYSQPSAEKLRLFARSGEKFEKPVEQGKNETKQLPCSVPSRGTKAVLDKGYKILMLDQRGTGMSTTITAELLKKRGGAEDQASYLKHFRGDNIVRDAEAIREVLTKDYPEEKRKWSVLGQSFGGFCAVNYLSRFPEGLQEVFLTGGLPPLVKAPDKVYENLSKRIIKRSHQYYAKFPEDVNRILEICRFLSDNEVCTYTGGRLTPYRIRNLGIMLGFDGGFEDLHGLVLRMSNDLEMFGYLSRPTVQAVDDRVPFDKAILYALLHEPIYVSGAASNWSAQRTIESLPEYSSHLNGSGSPLMFTAEMITRETFDDYQSLAEVRGAAEILAAASDWPELYDEAALARNPVPVYAAVYFDDLYVDFDLSMDTAAKIANCKTFITNAMKHDAIRPKADEVMAQLFAMRDDVPD